jgi:hypothetical protein
MTFFRSETSHLSTLFGPLGGLSLFSCLRCQPCRNQINLYPFGYFLSSVNRNRSPLCQQEQDHECNRTMFYSNLLFWYATRRWPNNVPLGLDAEQDANYDVQESPDPGRYLRPTPFLH